jgi:hypothetical protein
MSASVVSRSSWKTTFPQPTGLRKRYLDEEAQQQTQRIQEIIPFSLDARVRSASNGPDIEWNPCYQTYIDRVQHLSKLNADRPLSVPEGYPSRVDAPWVWSGSSFDDEYIVPLSRDDIVEIEKALQHFKRRFDEHASLTSLLIPQKGMRDTLSLTK